MRVLFRILLILLAGVPIALVALAFLCLQDRPLVERSSEITPADIERANALLQQHDPRTQRSGATRTVAFTTKDLDLLANYGLNRFSRGAARVALVPGTVAVRASIEVPKSPFGRFLNIDAMLRAGRGLPEFDQLRIGWVPVPPRLANWAARRALDEYLGVEGHWFVADVVKEVQIADGELRVVYQWQTDLPGRIARGLIPTAERERVRQYHEQLARAAAAIPAQGGSLTLLLSPMLGFAAGRAQAGDPPGEARAALFVIAAYLEGRGVAGFLPEAKAWTPVRPRAVTLRGRRDLAQHFAISAALAAGADGLLSDAVGLFKELEDARRGSGFSFVDLAADRAGTRFGELAVSSRGFVARVGRGVDEADVMPGIAGLPESLSEGEFKRRYGGPGSPAFDALGQDIEQRVAACALYR